VIEAESISLERYWIMSLVLIIFSQRSFGVISVGQIQKKDYFRLIKISIFYSKTSHFKFNTIYNAYSETTNIDQILQRRTRDEHNKSIYDLDEEGNFKHSDKKRGVPLSDVWEIPYLNLKAKKRVGYPTQKPLLHGGLFDEEVKHEGMIILQSPSVQITERLREANDAY
jgi:hypothetical protein